MNAGIQSLVTTQGKLKCELTLTAERWVWFQRRWTLNPASDRVKHHGLQTIEDLDDNQIALQPLVVDAQRMNESQ